MKTKKTIPRRRHRGHTEVTEAGKIVLPAKQEFYFLCVLRATPCPPWLVVPFRENK
jgi:hypothetical protein